MEPVNNELELQERRKKRDPQIDHESYKRRVNWYKAGDVTDKELQFLYVLSEGNCFYCESSIDKPRFSPTDIRGFDHLIPREKGGKHTLSNLVVCCNHCNEKKGAYKDHPEE